MVITRLAGGLGNQLFQYAAGRAIASHLKVPLKLDISHYENQIGVTPRQYQLGLFNIAEDFVQEQERALTLRWQRRGFNRSISVVNRVCPSLGMHYLKDHENGFDNRVFEVRGNISLDGYWQSEKYFSSIEELLRKDLTFKREPDAANRQMMEAIQNSQSVCIHVRRGDYVQNPQANAQHGTCSLDYYERGIRFVCERVRDPHFFVFSDDPDWTHVNIRPSGTTTYVTHNIGSQDYEDLRLMGACKYFVTANSSFSWWGAWLGNYPEKMVVAPKVWFNMGTKQFSADIVPPNWIRL